jgi:hypothetical protein
VSKGVAGAVIGIGLAIKAGAVPLVSFLGTATVEITGLAIALGSVSYAVEKTVKKQSSSNQLSAASQGDVVGTINSINEKRSERMYLGLRNELSSMIYSELGGVRKDAQEYLDNRISTTLDSIMSAFTTKMDAAGIAPAVHVKQPDQSMEDNSQLHAIPHASLVSLVTDYLDAKAPGTLSPAYSAVVDAAGLAGNVEVRKHAQMHLARTSPKPNRVLPSQKAPQQAAVEAPAKQVPQPQQTMTPTPNEEVVLDLGIPQPTAATQV